MEEKKAKLLDVGGLHVRYGSFEAVKGVSFSLGEGEILGIVGESGSGKSTIAKTLIGLERPSQGKIEYFFGGGDPSAIPDSLQMIFQDAVGSLNPRMTVRQTLEEVLRHGRGVKPAGGAAAARRPGQATSGMRSAGEGPGRHTPEGLLSLVGLSKAVLDQYPREMSGGQCQRISVARALACNPKVLIADEPVSALDVSVQARVLNLLRDLRRELGLAIVLIAHDLAVVKNVCDYVCVMEKGLFVDVGKTEDVFENPKSEYTKHLLSVIPKIPTFLV